MTSSGADGRAATDRINEVVLHNPGISGIDLVLQVDKDLLYDVDDDPETAITAYAAAATYCCIDEDGRWWPTKPASLLTAGDRVRPEPGQRHALSTDDWLEVATVSAPEDSGLVSVTFTALDGFIHSRWNGLSPDRLVVYLPGRATR